MAGCRVGGGGAGRPPARRVAHQHQEPPRHVRAAVGRPGAEEPPPHSHHTLSIGMYHMYTKQTLFGVQLFLYFLFFYFLWISF